MSLQNIPAIAVVLTDKDIFSLRSDELTGADLIELRVDMFETIDNIENIFVLAKKKFNLPILCTVRSPSEGGKREFENRLEIYEKVSSICNFFDVEIFSNEIIFLKKLSEQNKITLIASYHRFDMTPSLNELERVFTEGKKFKADIVKVATMVNKKKDLETLLFFTLKHRDDGIVVIGMGEKGVPSRIINPVFGSIITYASLNISSAPGQISLKEMVNIFKILNLRK